MFHNGPAGVSRGDVLAYNYRCEKLSLLGIEVAGVYWCMGLRSVSIEPRSCLLLHSEPSIVSLNWQGSLVIRVLAIVQINGFPRKNRIALIGKNGSCPQFLLLHCCLLVIPQWDMNFCFFCFFDIWKVADLNLTDLHPKLRTVNYILAYNNWLAGGLELFFQFIYGIVLPIDELICFKMVYCTTN